MREPRIASHDDDPASPLADRLLLALGIWPHHSSEAGDEEVIEAAVIIRTNAHRYPMAAEDYGRLHGELEDLRSVAEELCSDLSGQTFDSSALRRMRALLGHDVDEEADDA